MRQVEGLDLSVEGQMESPEVLVTDVSVEIRPTVCYSRRSASLLVAQSIQS
jgi:hypothetical protein